MTKQNERRLYLYRFAKYSDIYSAYSKPNHYKVNRFKAIETEMKEANGYDLRITGTGSTSFSCAYRIDTPEGTVLVYHGANEVYRFII